LWFFEGSSYHTPYHTKLVIPTHIDLSQERLIIGMRIVPDEYFCFLVNIFEFFN